MAIQGIVQPTTFNDDVVILNNNPDFFNRNLNKQFIPFQMILTNEFPEGFLMDNTTFSYDNLDSTYEFVDRLNNKVTAQQMLRYQKHYGRPCIMCCVLDRAYQVVRIESCISPKVLTPVCPPAKEM